MEIIPTFSKTIRPSGNGKFCWCLVWVGGSKKDQNYADIIDGWSIIQVCTQQGANWLPSSSLVRDSMSCKKSSITKLEGKATMGSKHFWSCNW